MGASPARITAADFVTPPELRAWHLAAQPAGRVGGVRLELVAGPSGTALGRCYQQVPLRVLPPFRLAGAQPALLYLLNPTAGLLDGDAQRVEITARAGTRAVVTGQSATRIHPCLHGFATQQWSVRVEPGAVLVVLPGPAIPFRGCRYYQRVEIELEEDAGLVWGDLWLAGRYARGAASEQFQFALLVQDLLIHRQGRLVFRDRFCWRGPWDADTAAWHFGGALACGSLFVTGTMDAARVEMVGGLEGAVFPTAEGDTCLRWCGPPEQVTGAVVHGALRCGSVLGGCGGSQPWLLGEGVLAPNHWFHSSDGSEGAVAVPLQGK
jgi:urease accessory protein